MIVRSTPNGKEIDWVEVYDFFFFEDEDGIDEDGIPDYIDIETVHFERENEQELVNIFDNILDGAYDYD